MRSNTMELRKPLAAKTTFESMCVAATSRVKTGPAAADVVNMLLLAALAFWVPCVLGASLVYSGAVHLYVDKDLAAMTGLGVSVVGVGMIAMAGRTNSPSVILGFGAVLGFVLGLLVSLT